MRARLLTITGALALLAACSAPPVPPPADPPPPQASASSPPARPPSPRLLDPRWIRAQDDDPLERARLANEVGASALIAALDDGGAIEEVALGALPFADDAEIALDPLARIASNDPARRARALAAILAVAGKPRRSREALDPDGAKRAAAAVIAIARDVTIPADDRALAISAARALVAHGYGDPSQIPSDLDPKE